MRRRQLERLRTLIAALRPDNRFYSAKLPDGLPGSLEEFFENTPFTTKPELAADQRLHPPFGSNLTYPADRYNRFSQTSGTSGRPMRWLDTSESWDWMLDNWLRVFETAGVTSRDRIFFAFSFGPFLGFWVAFESASRLGCLCMPGGGMPTASRLAVILETGATVLCCTPTYAIHMAEVAAREGIDLSESKVRNVIVAGEPGGSIPATRRRIEELWPGARVVDHHGLTEVGPVSYGCPARADVLHIIESSYIAEIIDPETGQHAPRGVRGELVLTNLGRTGSPLLRYRTGDIVLADAEDRCQCGSSDMALLGGILGRADDMVVVRGVNVYPGAIENVLREAGGVAEYRVRVWVREGLQELSIEVEPEPSCDPALAHRIQARLRDALSLRIPVKLAASGALPRFEMKARRWVKE
jgi:phenylacetate-CoA ligase